jgi:hypothetical protein
MHDNKVPAARVWRVLGLRLEERLPTWKAAVNILNNQSRTADNGFSSSFVLGEVLTTPHRKKWPCYETDTCVSDQD